MLTGSSPLYRPVADCGYTYKCGCINYFSSSVNHYLPSVFMNFLRPYTVAAVHFHDVGISIWFRILIPHPNWKTELTVMRILARLYRISMFRQECIFHRIGV